MNIIMKDQSDKSWINDGHNPPNVKNEFLQKNIESMEWIEDYERHYWPGKAKKTDLKATAFCLFLILVILGIFC